MYQHLLAPIDGSATSGRGLREAIGLAKALGARITLLHVLDVYPFFGHSGWSGQLEMELQPRRAVAQDLLASAAAQVQEAGVPVSNVLKECLEPHAGAEIVRQVKELKADVIVMGTHGRRGISRMLLGGDAMIVLRDSSVPVLLIGPSEAPGSD
ncbi:universal stress protein [Roseateles sp. SL47]|uniref:universal stress protein n=1 Tax=Roseateles sp. SL47 TaxID=2995138 RepID=UPI00226DDF83|nr:universal stress protein [Roseateles sp. SL47]WAC75676.1 universal stress protein [Roseateles sp. SL47]